MIDSFYPFPPLVGQTLSSLRSLLLAVQHQLPQFLEECLGRGPLLPARSTHCGESAANPTATATAVSSWSTVLSYRGQGRPRNISPPPEQLESLRSMTLDYRRCRQARAKLVRWQRQLLKLVDALEAARVQEGEAVFRKLCASPSLKKPRPSSRS